MASGSTNFDEQSLHASCAARVLILVDVADFAAKNGAMGLARETALCIDSVRLSVLRALLQLCSSCHQNSWLEWTTRFFDSRHSGVGKTPSELRARLRSRLSVKANRGFTRVTQASFQAFGEACLAVACGVQGDPLARDRETTLKRWARRQKEPPPAGGGRRGGGGETKPDSSGGQQASSAASGERSGGPIASSAGFDPRASRSGDEGPRRMYDGHDMSSHEVVVRTLLEVVQDFGESSSGQRNRADAPLIPGAAYDIGASKPQQLLLLYGGCPRKDDDVECFVLRGNFTPEAAAFDDVSKSPKARAELLMKLLNAQLGKAVLSIGSRGVSFVWQDGFAKSDPANSIDDTPSSIPPEGYLHRCLSAAGGRGIIGWGRIMGSSTLLPPSAALARHFDGSGDRGKICDQGNPVGLRKAKMEGEQWRVGTTVQVALNLKGIVDVHLTSLPLSDRRRGIEWRESSEGRVVGSTLSCAVTTVTQPQSEPQSTPWRLMGTVSIDQVWPDSLVDQGWGATSILRGDNGYGYKRWREFLRELQAKGMAAVVTLPCRLFRSTISTRSDDNKNDDGVEEVPTVAIMMPVSGECALGWSMERPEAEVETISSCAGGAGCASRPSLLGVMGENAHPVSQAVPSVGSFGDVVVQAGLMLEIRENEVGRAVEEALLARRRRRQVRGGAGEGARGFNNLSSSTSAAGYQGTWSGGIQAPLREPGSRCSTGEDTSCGGAVDTIRQWRLEVFSETSRLSGSPRGCRLFANDSGVADEDERTSCTDSSSGPRRALEQAFGDVSSRSSLLDPDSLSTLSSREVDGWTAGATVQRQRVDKVMGPGSEDTEGPTHTRGETSEATNLAEMVGDDASELPLSFMSEPALACLPGQPLPDDLTNLGKTCALANENAAGDARERTDLFPEVFYSPAWRSVKAKRKFIDAVRSFERMEQAEEADCSKPKVPPPVQPVTELSIPVSDRCNGEEKPQGCVAQESLVGKGTPSPVDEGFCTSGDGNIEVTGGFEHRVSSGVCVLLKQYREVVEGGQRSPLDFALHALPEAVRDLTDDRRDSSRVEYASDDRNARAAQVLAAVVSGLTCTPWELSMKHGAKRGTRPAMDAGEGIKGAAGGVAKPVIQKIRDYQLQALLLCQFHTLAMDLPDTPQSGAVFSALEADADNPRASKGRSGKGKGKKRRRKDNKPSQASVPVRPSDPLPDHHRARLVNLLQPISTLLESRTIVRAPLGSEGGAGVSEAMSGGADGSRSRAYDGTLADFMGLALVENFGPRLPRTLAALFEDFEYHPPDALATMLMLAGACQKDTDAVEVGAINRDGRTADVEMEMIKGRTVAMAVVDGCSGTALLETEPAKSNPRIATTAGILLSDRTPMAHNHFKNSGVLNGFPKIKVKTVKCSKGSSGGGDSIRGILSGSGTDGTAYGAFGGKDGIENGKWRDVRDREKGGRGSRGATSRAAARESKHERGYRDYAKERNPVLATEAAASDVRQSPRLVRRRRQSEASQAGVEDSKATTSVSGRKRSPSSSTGSNIGSLPRLVRSRRVTASIANLPGSTGSSGILVGETPRKGSARKHRVRDGIDHSAHDDSHEGTIKAVKPATRKPPKVEAPRGQFRGSPAENVRSRSPTVTNPLARRRTFDYPSPEIIAAASKGEPLQTSCEAASAATRLFVAESPGVGVPVDVRRNVRNVRTGGDMGSACCNLMSERASPAPRDNRSVVPDTPA